MKQGDIVMIYEDPVTKRKPEGKARLIEKLIEDDAGHKYWHVRFVSDGFVVGRWIEEETIR